MDNKRHIDLCNKITDAKGEFMVQKVAVLSILDVAHSLSKLVDTMSATQNPIDTPEHINKNDKETLPKSKPSPPEDESLQSKYLNEYMSKNVFIKLCGNEEIEGELVDVTNNQFVVTTEDDDICIHDIDDVVFISLID